MVMTLFRMLYKRDSLKDSKKIFPKKKKNKRIKEHVQLILFSSLKASQALLKMLKISSASILCSTSRESLSLSG